MKHALLLALTLSSGAAHAAVSTFLCVPGVTGTCTIVTSNPGGTLLRANGWVTVTGHAWGITNPAPASDPYGTTTPSLGAIEVTKAADDTSPTWLMYALQGTPIEVRFATRKTGGNLTTLQPYTILTLTGARVSVAQQQITGDTPLGERLTFDGATGIELKYWKQKVDGSLLQPPLTATWP